MSLGRRGASVVFRLRSVCSQSTQSSVDLHTATTTQLQSLATLSILSDSWRSHASGFNNNNSSHSYSPFNHTMSRNFSIFPGSGSKDNDNDDIAAPLDASEAIAPSSSIDTSSFSDYTPDTIVTAGSIAETAALASAFEGVWAPTKALLWTLSTVHDATGLQWWQSIMATTLGMRLLSFPVILMQIKNTHRLTQARPEIEKLLEHLKEEQAKGNPNATSEYQTRVMAVWTKYKANPMKSMATLVVQAPLFIGFFSALRGLAAAKVPSLAEGGMLWFTDLTVADPTYGLPIIASMTFLLTVEAGAADGMEGQPDKMKSRMKNIMRGVALIIVPFTVDLPASVFMYWTASNAFSLMQTLVLKLPGVKKALGLPMAMNPRGGDGVGKPIETFAHKPITASKKKKKKD